MKKLPIGKQHFELFKEQNLLYVDKTELLYQLLMDANYYFLSHADSYKTLQKKREVKPIEWEVWDRK